MASHQLVSAKDILLALVLVLSLQKAQLRLSQQDAAATPLASLDPDEQAEQ